ncbi:MAG: hypothetical protein R3F43_12540 [bacterium]
MNVSRASRWPQARPPRPPRRRPLRAPAGRRPHRPDRRRGPGPVLPGRRGAQPADAWPGSPSACWWIRWSSAWPSPAPGTASQVAPLPGVTDSAGENLLEAAHALGV